MDNATATGIAPSRAIVTMVGKFLETRADTLSAVVVGTPDALASALTKIGFTQLYPERYHTKIRVFEWFQLDSHPPTYFRVQRLARISREGSKIKHAFWTSVRDCFTGFAGSFVSS
jgi:Zn-dependent protease with chaperone function